MSDRDKCRTPMRVLFYCPSHQGHHFPYLARMMPAFAELPIELCLATTPGALESEEYARNLSQFADRLTPYPVCNPAPRGTLRITRHRLRELSRVIQELRPDHVAVCYADGIWELALVQTLAGRRPWPRTVVVEGWLYRTRFGDLTDRRVKSRLRRQMFSSLLRTGVFRKLHLDGELLFDFAEALAAKTPTEVVLTPNPVVVEPIISKTEARRALALPTDGTWLSLSGMIARFKGADLLLQAFKSVCESNQAEGLRLLLAGPHEEAIRSLLLTPPFAKYVVEGRIHSLDRIVNEHEMYLAAAAADLVLAPYPHHHGRSSIILWAAAAGRPSLGAEDGGIGYVIRNHGLGATCNVLDNEKLAEALVNSLSASWTDADVARVRAYALTHRIENYQEVASKLVRSRLAERPAP